MDKKISNFEFSSNEFDLDPDLKESYLLKIIDVVNTKFDKLKKGGPRSDFFCKYNSLTVQEFEFGEELMIEETYDFNRYEQEFQNTKEYQFFKKMYESGLEPLITNDVNIRPEIQFAQILKFFASGLCYFFDELNFSSFFDEKFNFEVLKTYQGLYEKLDLLPTEKHASLKVPNLNHFKNNKDDDEDELFKLDDYDKLSIVFEIKFREFRLNNLCKILNKSKDDSLLVVRKIINHPNFNELYKLATENEIAKYDQPSVRNKWYHVWKSLIQDDKICLCDKYCELIFQLYRLKLIFEEEVEQHKDNGFLRIGMADINDFIAYITNLYMRRMDIVEVFYQQYKNELRDGEK